MILCSSLETCANCFALLLVAGLVEQGEHISLVILYTGLVEGVNAKNVTADTAGNLEEVDELTNVILVELGD